MFSVPPNVQKISKPIRQVKPFNTNVEPPFTQDSTGDRDYRIPPQSPQPIPLNRTGPATNMFTNPPPKPIPPPNLVARLPGGVPLMHRMDIPPPIVSKPPPPIPLKNNIIIPRMQRLRPNLTIPPPLPPQQTVKLDSPKPIQLDSPTINYLNSNNDNVIIIPDPDLILNFTM